MSIYRDVTGHASTLSSFARAFAIRPILPESSLRLRRRALSACVRQIESTPPESTAVGIHSRSNPQPFEIQGLGEVTHTDVMSRSHTRNRIGAEIATAGALASAVAIATAPSAHAAAAVAAADRAALSAPAAPTAITGSAAEFHEQVVNSVVDNITQIGDTADSTSVDSTFKDSTSRDSMPADANAAA